ncbi:MAG: tetratricopeptide repeat protein [Alphaproteobacteria bacterium]|nr:tetratricopeptide repeat protein [Alphaproteobacteria bacterium]
MSGSELVQAVSLIREGDFAQAAALLRQAIRDGGIDPRVAGLLYGLERQRGDTEAARAAAARWTDLAPASAEAWTERGTIESIAGGDAETCWRKALALEPDRRDAALGLGLRLQARGEHEAALALWAKLEPEAALAVSAGYSLLALGRSVEAEAEFRRGQKLGADDEVAWLGLGIALANQRRGHQALEALARALAREPKNDSALYYQSVAYDQIGQVEQALASAEATIAANPRHFAAMVWAGHCCLHLGRQAEAEVHFRHATEGRPYDRAVQLSIAQAWDHGQDASRVLEALAPVLAADPNDHAALISASEACVRGCQFAQYEAMRTRLIEGVPGMAEAVRLGALGLNNAMDGLTQLVSFGAPYGALVGLATAISERIGRPGAEDRAAHRQFAVHGRGRIRIAYISATATFHSTQLLVRNLARRHDRERFEVYGYAVHRRPDLYGDGRFAETFAAAFDRFRFLDDLDEIAAAESIRRDGIDIAIEMQGLHAETGMHLLARRVAPVQCHYAGYCISTGADYVDYLLLDDVFMPPRHARLCREHVVLLPDCFAAASAGAIDPSPVMRPDFGLPEDGFVFAAFNHPWKLDPETFDLWMSLLVELPGSVLWLGAWRKDAIAAMAREAEARGVDRRRLVVAKLATHHGHLRRLSLADLALDTGYTQGGVTTMDALWAGLPVLTAIDLADSPHARYGASILRAAELGELVAADRGDYRRIALELARNPGRMAELRGRLQARRGLAPLFDLERSARHLEQAYSRMVERWREGKAPQGFAVEPLPPRTASWSDPAD